MQPIVDLPPSDQRSKREDQSTTSASWDAHFVCHLTQPIRGVPWLPGSDVQPPGTGGSSLPIGQPVAATLKSGPHCHSASQPALHPTAPSPAPSGTLIPHRWQSVAIISEPPLPRRIKEALSMLHWSRLHHSPDKPYFIAHLLAPTADRSLDPLRLPHIPIQALRYYHSAQPRSAEKHHKMDSTLRKNPSLLFWPPVLTFAWASLSCRLTQGLQYCEILDEKRRWLCNSAINMKIVTNYI